MQLHDVIVLQFHICFFIQTCSVEEAVTCHVPSSVHIIVRVPVLSNACEGLYAYVHACVCARLHADMHLIVKCMHFPHSPAFRPANAFAQHLGHFHQGLPGSLPQLSFLLYLACLPGLPYPVSFTSPASLSYPKQSPLPPLPPTLPGSCPHKVQTLTRTCFARQWDPTTPKRLAFLVPCRVHSQNEVNRPTITRIDRAGHMHDLQTHTFTHTPTHRHTHTHTHTERERERDRQTDTHTHTRMHA